eukprot:scaffold5636_cov159-Ochromonas_danica.AAC.20
MSRGRRLPKYLQCSAVQSGQACVQKSDCEGSAPVRQIRQADIVVQVHQGDAIHHKAGEVGDELRRAVASLRLAEQVDGGEQRPRVLRHRHALDVRRREHVALRGGVGVVAAEVEGQLLVGLGRAVDPHLMATELEDEEKSSQHSQRANHEERDNPAVSQKHFQRSDGQQSHNLPIPRCHRLAFSFFFPPCSQPNNAFESCFFEKGSG